MASVVSKPLDKNKKKLYFLTKTYVVGTQKNCLIGHPKQMLKLMDNSHNFMLNFFLSGSVRLSHN